MSTPTRTGPLEGMKVIELAVVEVEYPRAGRTRSIGFPVKVGDTPAQTGRGAPMLGEHTREVLAEFGYPDDDINALFAEGVVRAE